MDVAGHRVAVDGVPVPLTPREFQVLRELLRHPGRLVTHGRLLRAVWGTAYDEESHYVHVYVSAIRRKIAAADPAGRLRDLIVAEPGLGYRVREDARPTVP
jgi:two-component system KDP operon response regulator KdpE